MTAGFLKKSTAKKEKTTSLAGQLIKGIIAMTRNLSLLVSNALVATMAGTLHPKPRSKGTRLLPCKPSLCINLSIEKQLSGDNPKIP